MARLSKNGETLLAVARDVTDQKRNEEILRTATRAAQAADAAKSEFLANMSHELRTPLNSIIGFSNLLLKEKPGPLTDPQSEYLKRVRDNGVRLLGLINDVLDLSKIEAGHLDVIQEDVDLAAMVDRVMASLDPQASAKGLHLDCEFPSGIAPLRADVKRLEQVIINLVANALKFTDEGGVRLRVAEMDGRAVRLDVIDTGVGVAKNKIEHLFKAFAQADSSTSREYGGTGLGLSISRALAEPMGFEFHVASEVGGGSLFSLVFGTRAELPNWAAPKWPESLPKRPEAAPERLPPPRSSHEKAPLVLVVDDDADARSVLERMLQEDEYRVVSCSHPRDGIEIARTISPDVMTLDLMMPEVDGVDVLAQLREDPATQDIPVVVVSIVGSDKRQLIASASEIVDKPYPEQDLRDALRRALTRPTGEVLIVDDNADNRALMHAMVKEHGARVREADNGATALLALQEQVPDLILLDLSIPRMNGFDFLSALRADTRYRDTRVVVVTAQELTKSERSELLTRSELTFKKDGGFASALDALLAEYGTSTLEGSS